MSLRRQRSRGGVVEWMQHIPLGFRFRPTDLEAFAYLFSKIHGNYFEKLPLELVQEFDVYVSEPCKLPRNEEDEFAYYFTKRCYLSKSKINRYTKDGIGYWRISGTTWKTNAGKKNTLVYHIKSKDERGKGQKTNWIMHEYVLLANAGTSSHRSKTAESPLSRKYVLCRIYHRKEHEEKEIYDWTKDGHEAFDWPGLLRMLGEPNPELINYAGDLYRGMDNDAIILNLPAHDPLSDTGVTRDLVKQMDQPITSNTSVVEKKEENHIDLSWHL